MNSSYRVSFDEAQAGRTQGFWANHSEAWDGIHTNDVKWQKLVGTDLTAAEINPKANGDVLIGDLDRSGTQNNGEVTLLVSNAAAKSILSGSVGGDNRLAMLQQGIAAQLNIYNGDINPGEPWPVPNATDKLAGDMITELVQWMKSYGGSALSDGIITSSEYNTSTGKFATALTAAQKTSFWNTSRDVDGTSADIHATGEDLKNVLAAFNSNKLVTSADDQVGWNQNTTNPEHVLDVVDAQANGPDAFWDVVHDHINNFGGLTWHG